MAFNWQTFKTRTLTAIVFAALMLSGLLWNYWSFFILFSIIHAGCWWEYMGLLEKIFNAKMNAVTKYFFCISGYLFFLSVVFSSYSYDFWIMLFGLELSLKWGLVILFLFCLVAFLFQNKTLPQKLKYGCILGFAYISLSWGLMVSLYRNYDIHVYDTMYVLEQSFLLPLLIIISIWINDTMAYIVGSFIGKTPLSKISPKKTWEGTIGGVILSIIVVGLISFYGLKAGPISIPIMIVAAIASITGTLGDLVESKLKRLAGVKDSGSIMPGHGGFLDRFDSLLLATPFVWLYITIFMH